MFLTDTISVGKGTFDTKDLEVDVDEAIIKKLCEKYPKDIREVSESDVIRPSKVEKDGKTVESSVKPEAPKDEKPKAGEGKQDPPENQDQGNQNEQGQGQNQEAKNDPPQEEAHPKKEENITGNEIKAFLKTKEVQFDKKANKSTLYALYVKACNKQ